MHDLKPPEGIRLREPAEVERTYIEMRDGVKLYLEVFKPEGPGSFPTILIRNPYHAIDVPPQTRDQGTHKEFVERGYAVVEAEVRGTGLSEGSFRFLRNDGKDGYDTILWIRDQPWCNGKIGLTGFSYLSMDQFAVAAQNPPGLKAMFAGVGGADIYADMVYPGGIMATLAFNWAQRHVMRIIAPRLPQLRRAPDPVDPRIYLMQEKVHGERLLRDLDHLLTEGRLFDTDYVREWIEHPNDGEYWREQSPYTFFPKIRTPIYLLGGWFDIFTSGVIRTFLEIDAPKRLLIGPWFHAETSGIDRTALQLRWFDHWLKGIENGVMEEAPVMYYVMGREEWKLSADWPPETQQLTYYLHPGTDAPRHSINDGVLSRDPPLSDEGGDKISHDPQRPVPSVGHRNVDLRRGERRMLTYTTEPLQRDVEVVGSVRVHLSFSTRATDVDWIAKLTEVLPGGESILLSSGALRGSHYRSHEFPKDLEAGRVYEIDIDMPPTAKVFKSGNRLRLSIANSDFPLRFPNPLPSESMLHHNRREASYVTLPVI